MAEPSVAEKEAVRRRLRQLETLVLAPEVDQLAREYYTQEEYDAKFKKKKKKVKKDAFRGQKDKTKTKTKKKGLTADDLLDDLAEPLAGDPVPMDVDRGSDDSDSDAASARGVNDEDLSKFVLEPDEAQVRRLRT